MAKRFTDTEKWKKPWFRALTNEAKVCWFYILDECDHRGVWSAAFDRMSFDLKFEVTKQQFESWFANKIQRFDDDKYFISDFIDFQYGDKLSRENRAHKAIFTLIDSLAKEAPSKDHRRGLLAPYEHLEGDKVTVKVTDKVKVKEQVSDAQKLENRFRHDYKRLFLLYPNYKRSSEHKALELMSKAIGQQTTYDELELAISNFKAFHEAEKTNDKYIKLFENWFSDWRQWINPPSPKNEQKESWLEEKIREAELARKKREEIKNDAS